MNLLLLGMGNPILSDDAIGVRLAADCRTSLSNERSEPRESFVGPTYRANSPHQGLPTFASRQARLDIVQECSVGGINLIDVLRGYDRVVVFDSLQTSDSRPGAWHRFTAEALRDTVHLTNIHDANFATALAFGRRLGLPLPEDSEIHIFAVEIQDNRTFSERMTPALEQAYPQLRAGIFRELRELLDTTVFSHPSTSEAGCGTSPPPSSSLPFN